MSKTLLITAIGSDRVGIVADLTELLYESGCNLLDSSMTYLRGQFAILLMASVDNDEKLGQLTGQIAVVEKKQRLQITVREISEPEAKENAQDGNAFIITVYGADQPGIVSHISRKLADLGVNITDVQTKQTSHDAQEPKAKSLFLMILEVLAPEPISLAELKKQLKYTADQISVDISISPLETAEL